MEVQNILLTGISSVTAALCFVVKILFVQMKTQFEKGSMDRQSLHASNSEMQVQIVKLSEQVGHLTAFKELVLRCGTPGCPFGIIKMAK